jgi:hypothetical protein
VWPTSCCERSNGALTELSLTCKGLSAVTGVVPSMRSGVHDADAVAFLTPKRVAWVILDGRPWTPAERTHALSAIAAHLGQA